MNQSETNQTQKNKLYILTIQDETGSILKIMTHNNYETLWLTGTAESKVMRGYWTLFDLNGINWRFVDGNYRAKVTK